MSVVLLLVAIATAQTEPKSETADVKVVVDTSRAPAAQEWGEATGRLVTKWYPTIAELLQSEGFTPPGEVKLVFNKGQGIAGTAGRTIFVSADWIEKNYDKAIVSKLNRAMRQSKYKDELFQEYTGKSVDELWQEFAGGLKKQ